jgi:hypothetical protein
MLVTNENLAPCNDEKNRRKTMGKSRYLKHVHQDKRLRPNPRPSLSLNPNPR